MLQNQLNCASEVQSEMKTLLEKRASKILYLEKVLYRQSRNVPTSSLDLSSGAADPVCKACTLFNSNDVTCHQFM